MAGLDVIDPRDGSIVATVASSGVDGVAKAVDRAHRALGAWSLRPVADRSALVASAIERWQARSAELIDAVTVELGQPERFTRTVHVDAPIAGARRLVALVDDVRWARESGASTVERLPVGVVAALTPWNYPVHQILAKVVPALLAGCTVVLKPSELAPSSARILFDELAAVVPPGVVELIQGEGLLEGAALVTHGGIDHVSFTGSVVNGRAVASAAIRHGASTALELGGKSAAVLLPDLADDELARASRYVVADVMSNAGQTCTALTRLIVPRSKLDLVLDATAAASGRFTRGGMLGPVRTAAAVERLKAAIDDAERSGATVHVDGRAIATSSDGFWFGPTVVTGLSSDAPLVRNELFGPVLVVLTYDDSARGAGAGGATDHADASALVVAVATDYDLSAAVWSADPARAEAFARTLRVGQVRINGGAFDHAVPFGGFGRSGDGREWGIEGIESFTRTRALVR